MSNQSRFSKQLQATSYKLLRGGVVVMPTDTIYGIVGQALNKKTVERLYVVRHRNPAKPFIVLISSLLDLKKFGVSLSSSQKSFCEKVWPGKVSIILPCRGKSFSYLHRGTNSLAFRMPKPAWLRSLIRKTGPLVAPSANPEGLKPAQTVGEARNYFDGTVDMYVSGGSKVGKPSTLVSFLGQTTPVVLRPGAVKIKIEAGD
jgi:L-threonylcarbamoyladenylate synthase